MTLFAQEHIITMETLSRVALDARFYFSHIFVMGAGSNLDRP